jgi:hypothetical protein
VEIQFQIKKNLPKFTSGQLKGMTISWLKNIEIDRKKWDACISRSVNDLPYGHCWYLDIVSPGWDALVMDDYDFVMPLTWKKKFGIRYLYQPLFTQQLGVFGPDKCENALTTEFLNAIPAVFRLADIRLNETNQLSESSSLNPVMPQLKFNSRLRKNYLLPLELSYNEIYKGFNRNCTRNIKNAFRSGLKVTDAEDNTLSSSFVSKQLLGKNMDHGGCDVIILNNLFREAIAYGKGELYDAIDPQGKTVASAFFLKGSKRLIFHICASASEGKEANAMSFLVNHAVEKYAGSGLVLDFSGSVMPGVAYFNSSFGARPVDYYSVFINRLPLLIRWMK